MKKLFILVICAAALCACASVKGMQESVNCKYNLAGVEVTDAGFSNVTMNVGMAVTNNSKTNTASMNRFEGRLFINDIDVSAVSFGAYEVLPSSTSVVKTTLNIPIANIGKNIAGLVAANSISLKYKIVGKIYFDTPLGQIPFPIVVEPQIKK